MKGRKLWKDMRIISFLDQGLVSGSNFLVSVILARGLGMETFGQYTFIILIGLFVSGIQQGFIIAPMQTYLPTCKTKQEHLHDSSQLWLRQTAFSCAAFILTVISVWLFKDWGVAEYAWLIGGFIATLSVTEFFRRLAYCIDKSHLALLLDGIGHLAKLVILGFLYFYKGLDFRIVLEVHFGLSLLSALLGMVVFKIKFTFKPDLYLWRRDWRYAKWLVGTALLQWVSGNYFLVAASDLLGMAALGAIRIAQNIIGVIGVLFLAIENYIPVEASKHYHNGGYKAMINYLQKTILALIGPIAGLLVITAIFAQPILSRVYGAEYAAHAYLLQLFAFLQILIFLIIPLRNTLRTLEKTRTIFISYVLNAGFSLLAAYWMIGQWSLHGVIAGMFISQAIILSTYLYTITIFHSTYKMSTLDTNI